MSNKSDSSDSVSSSGSEAVGPPDMAAAPNGGGARESDTPSSAGAAGAANARRDPSTSLGVTAKRAMPEGPGRASSDAALSAAPTGAAAQSRRNYVLGVLNGMIGTAAFDFVHPDLILAGLVFTISKPAFGDRWAFFLVAVLAIINKGAGLLPQLYVSSYLEHKSLKRPFYIGLTYMRGFGAAALVASIWALGVDVNVWTMLLFFASWLVISVSMGAGFPVAMDMFGRMIRIDRIGSFLGTREFLGGLLSLVAGLLVVTPILDRSKGSADLGLMTSNYFWLCLVGGLLMVASMGLLIMCHEEPGPRAKRATTIAESLIRGWRWVKRNPDYRAYLWLRIAFRINDLSMVFFIVYGTEKLARAGTPAEMAAQMALLGGVMVAVFKLSRVVSSALWGWMVDSHSDRACLVGTGVCFTLAPALALAAPLVPHVFEVPLPLTSATMDLPLAVYLAALMVIGAAYQGSVIGGNRFLIGRAPPRRRLSYIGFLNTVTSPLTLMPMLAAFVAAELGVTALFIGIVGGGVMYLVAALRVRPEAERISEQAEQPSSAAEPDAAP